MSEPLDPIFVVDFSCFSFFSQPHHARSWDLIDFAGWHWHPTTDGKGFPGGSVGKESAYSEGEVSSIPVLGISPREGNGNPLQYSCLEKSMDRGA